MIHVNPTKVQTRRACNRCHQAKLKCVVENGRKCQRCKRANSDCTFSPPSRGQQQIQPRSPLPISPNRIDDHSNTWPDSFDWDFSVDESVLSALGFEPEIQSGAETATCDSYPTPTSYHKDAYNSTTHSQASSANGSIANLAALGTGIVSASTDVTVSADIFTARPALPMPSIHALPASSGVLSNSDVPGPDSLSQIQLHERSASPNDPMSWSLKMSPILAGLTQHVQSIPRFHVDDCTDGSRRRTVSSPHKTHNSDHTFDLSESFIDVLSEMCASLPSAQGSDPGGSRVDDSSRFDEVSYLLVYATYLRFLEMHDTVFRYLLVCLSHKREGSKTGSCFYLPKLIIGSFSLAKTSETRPLLFVSLMESMVTRAKSHFEHLSSISADVGFTDVPGSIAYSSSVIEPAFALQAVREKEHAIFALIERIKTTLSRPKVMNNNKGDRF
ncbi:hypothetical protein E8E13_000199 [Curvularia kusanoi]|uniref:Zn(2)-C6 fungal-type domain-containing protein n=1 Tax=Curvularia kusanoi TaxID=90978 RepID=A0A9P4TE09_CURKU|nr:hypothetical protein E8E13_000199 [Curvularia kusanoi]